MKNIFKLFTVIALLSAFPVSGAKAQGAVKVSSFKIATPPKDAKIKVITITVKNMDDRMAPNYLGMQIRLTKKGYYGLESESSNPTIIRLFMNVNEPVDEKFLKAIVEQKELNMPVHGGGSKLVQLNFQYVGLEKKMDTLSRKDFLIRQFDTYSKTFNKNTKTWGGKNEAVYELEYPGLDKPLVTKNLPYLSSHLSLNDGFLGIETLINDNEEYAFRIRYSKDVLNDDKIWEVLTRDKWSTVNREGEMIQIDPKISFTKKGATLSSEPIKKIKK